MTRKSIQKHFLPLIAVMLIAAMLLASCNSGGDVSQSDSSAPAEDVSYSVTVKDPFGEPFISGVAVEFLQNGERVAMQPCSEDGVAAKTLPAGDYEISLAFSGGAEGYRWEASAPLTADAPNGEATVWQTVTGDPQVVTVGTTDLNMYPVVTGATLVELTPGVRNYFLFTPTVAGNYEFCLLGETEALIGYYGAPHYVMENSAAAVTDNRFTMSIKASMIGTGDGGTTTLVLGVDAGNASSCTLGIRRIGDPIKTIEDEPWIVYEAEKAPSAYRLPAGTALQEFDFTKEYTLVYNETDGFYHLDSADGPLVLMRLTEDSEYMDSYQTILEHTGVTKYFYDEEGNFDKKESYSDCLMEYIGCADEASGVYPLTEDLKYIVQQHGDYQGWWDPESRAYLFVDMDGNPEPGINLDIAWLLMCCYAE